MANHRQSKKRIRQTHKRTERNKNIRTSVRTYVKRVRVAIEAADKGAADAALEIAVKKIDAAVTKGIYHRRTGSRYVSRLSSRVAAL